MLSKEKALELYLAQQPTVSESDLKTVVSRINEIATMYCSDYPSIAGCKPKEQLYAIEEAFRGVMAANVDLHVVISKMKDKLNLSDAQYIELVESC